MDNTTDSKGYLLLLLPIIGWGLAPNIVEIGLDHIDPLPFLTYRFMTAALAMTPYILIKKQSQVRLLLKNKWTWIIGIAQTWAIVFQYLSQLYIIPSLSALIAYSYMVLVPFVSVFILRQRLNKNHLPIVLTAAIGLILIAFEEGYDLIDTSGFGLFLAFLSTWGYAIYITSTSKLTKQSGSNVDSIALFYIIMIIVTIAGLILSFLFQPDFTVNSNEAWISILLLMVISTVIAYIAYIESLKYISANTASVVLLLQIVIPFTIDFIVYSRTFDTNVIIGSLLIFVSSFFAVKISDH